MIYLFDSYVLDDENLCLTRLGQRIALEPRALGVLLLMVRSNGKLLKKDSILQAVWRNTVVEESTLSRVIAMLRKQLQDDPRNPKFIETVPTFGYRFIATVERQEANAPPPEPSETPPIVRAPPSVSPETQAVPGVDPPTVVLDSDRRAPRLAVRAGLVALLLAFGGAVWVLRAPRPMLPLKRSIVLADFSNSTGESVFDGALRQAIMVQLEQSPVLNLLSETNIQAMLRLMGQKPDVRLTPALAREVCQRAGSGALLEGSIAGLGGQYVLGLLATNCGNGDVIDSEQVQASRREDVLVALDQIATRFRIRVGESLNSASATDTPLQQATTSSLEALKAYSEANRVGNLTGSAAAIPLLESAITLDPQFAIAHAMLGRMYGDVGQESRSARSTAQAYEYRDRASERERFFIVASYQMQVTGNLEKAEETCETWGRVYPEENGALGFPTGVILRVFGRYEQAVETGRRLVALDPNFAIGYHLLAANEIALDRLDEAAAVLDAASVRQLSIPFYALDRYRIAFLRGDQHEIQRQLSLASRQPVTEDLLAGQHAASLAYAGRMNASREASQRAVSLAVQSGRPELAARFEAARAVIESLVGNADAASVHATAALGLSQGRDAVYGAATALALVQSSRLAEELADDLEKRFAEDTAARFLYVPTIRALLALNHGNPVGAIELLRVSTAYELGTPQSGFLGFYGTMYPVFVRGRAYLTLHHDAEAAAEFRKILDHRSLTVNDPIGSLAYLELGRSLASSGDTDRAKAAYAAFLNLWGDADSDMPLLEAAKRDYARL